MASSAIPESAGSYVIHSFPGDLERSLLELKLVAACGYGAVERGVGAGHELDRRRRRLGRDVKNDADAGRDMQRLPAHQKQRAGDLVDNFLCDVSGHAGFCHVFQNGNELVPGQAGHRVGAAHAGL